MSKVLRISVSLALLCLPGAVLAAGFDPASLRTVLGIDIGSFHSATGGFGAALQRLGAASQVDTGDAGSYAGSVSYVDPGAAVAIRFTRTECTDGYRIGSARDVANTSPGRTQVDLAAAGSGALTLGAAAETVAKLLNGRLSGGWRLESRKQSGLSWQWSFEKTIHARNGDGFCDHIWLTLGIAAGKLASISVESGGCDDSPCGR